MKSMYVTYQEAAKITELSIRTIRQYVYTGKTGEESWKMSSYCNVEIISGH